MTRVLFDPHFAQAWQHRRDLGLAVPPFLQARASGRWAIMQRIAYALPRLRLMRNSQPRLQSVCEILVALGLEPVFPENELPAASELDDVDVIVTGSRLKALTDNEIATLVTFAQTRGGLLIMSNHGAPEGAPNDFTRHDRALVRRFGIELECTAFSDPDRRRTVRVSVDHPTTKGIQALSINNCSSLNSTSTRSVIDIPATWKDRLAATTVQGRAVAAAIDEGIDGRVFVLSDSGFMGNEGTRSPGPGLIHDADNRQFLTNVFSWLAKRDLPGGVPSRNTKQ